MVDRPLPLQSLLSAIVQSSDDAIISKDLRGVVTSWNPAAVRLFGYTAAEMIGRSIRTIIPQDRQHEEDLVLERIAAGESVDHFETLRLHKDGSYVYISLTVSPILDASGTIVGASKIARDISERLRARVASDRVRQQVHFSSRFSAALVRTLDSSRRLSSLVDVSVPDLADWCAVDLVTPGGRIERLAAKHVGAGKHPFVKAHDGDVDVPNIFAEVIRSGVAVSVPAAPTDASHSIQERLKHWSPLTRPLCFTCLPLIVNGRVAGAIGFAMTESQRRYDEEDIMFLKDVSSRTALALEGARAYEELEAANRTKDEFLATLSHELRTPLNAILGYARMLRSGIVKDDRRESAIGILERNATSLTQIVEDVLDISRIASGKIRLDVHPLDLAGIVGDAIGTIMPAADAKGVKVDLSIGPDTNLVSGDADRLRQVIWNLLSNAVKFTPRDGRIQVQLQRVNSHVEVIVSDTGLGIRAEFLPYLFERFRQADSTTTRVHGGLGLGLAIAKQIVELHGGRISASSDGEGKGAQFRVELPLTAPNQKIRPEESRIDLADCALDATTLSGVRVLVVDDDPDAREMIRVILSAAGAVVLTAESALEALSVIGAQSPDVLISDLAMPGMDGFELIRRVRALAGPQKNMPATALTAFARSEDRARALRCGFENHLAKPIDPVQLIEAVSSLLQRRTAVGSVSRRELL